jgi:carbonic anhydrase/acetyltransferase-like protein (isoleucine patch superfamily)
MTLAIFWYISTHLKDTSITLERTVAMRSPGRCFDPFGQSIGGRKRVELGAVLVVPGGEEVAAIRGGEHQATAASENSRPLYSSRVPILGNDVLRSWMERVRKLGVPSVWLTSTPGDESVAGPMLSGFARQGVERLLVIKLKSYAELDLADLIRFHCEKHNPVTEAQDVRGRLGVSLLDHLALSTIREKHELPGAATDSRRPDYLFNGYAKRILSANERQELVRDALTGACAIRPLGTEIREKVWIGEGVKLADSVRVIGPAYIGARTIVLAGATIGPFASVEPDCVVDCGTTVERSTVLPHTYLAPGLLIRHGLVDGGHLEDLDWGAVADLQPAGLGSRIHRLDERRQAFSKTATDVSSRAGRAPARGLTRPPTASQPWVEVRL